MSRYDGLIVINALLAATLFMVVAGMAGWSNHDRQTWIFAAMIVVYFLASRLLTMLEVMEWIRHKP